MKKTQKLWIIKKTWYCDCEYALARLIKKLFRKAAGVQGTIEPHKLDTKGSSPFPATIILEGKDAERFNRKIKENMTKRVPEDEVMRVINNYNKINGGKDDTMAKD